MPFLKVDMDYVNDHYTQIVKEINQGVLDWLEDSGQILEDRIKANTYKESGATAESWHHEVKHDSAQAACEVKSSYANASFEEFGTGNYTEVGHYPYFKGKIPWVFYDGNGWHTTDGKPARHPAQKSLNQMSSTIIENANKIVK